ncbi:MAG: hypothetical protein E7589_06090 [Ruminococcaceae bacterium]|nr:hypothetical protein [Oscillospiraceae bacterium]
MENINKYIYSLILTALIAVIVELVSPADDGGGLGKHVNLICGLCIAVALLNPLKEGAQWLLELARDGIDGVVETSEMPSVEHYGDAFAEQVYTVSESEIKRLLCKQFDISENDIEIRCDFDERYLLVRITVLLSGKAVFKDPHKITDYLSGAIGCEAVVAIT